ncbi:MAG TPA: response regulator transcription factor [Bryobacteraceae bacterium]
MDDSDHILVVEDDFEMAQVLRQGFEQERLSVQVAQDGEEGLRVAQNRQFQAIVLDVMLPAKDGFTVARELRAQGNITPILMLTARDSVADIVYGLDSGVDDYLIKPFSFLELSARVRALIRRAKPFNRQLEAYDLTLNSLTHEVRRGVRTLRLSKTEFRILEILMQNQGHVVRRREILGDVWGQGASVEENTLDAAMSSLRSRVEVDGLPRLIHTIRGFGYKLEAAE